MEEWLSCSLLYQGIWYSRELVEQGLPQSSGIEDDLFRFLEDWFSPSPFLTVHTSGSTGIPKELTIKKQQMMNSAQNTCSFLHLQRLDRALLCMPLRYIAGKMVVVRALVCQMELLLSEPSGHPMSPIHKNIDFVALIPLQVFNSLQNPDERELLMQVKNLIIGGGSIDKEMERELKSFPNPIYSSYGMTETLSHIALRLLNGSSPSGHYTPFPNVRLSLSNNQTLIIDAPDVCDNRLYTNDVVELYEDKSFIVIGRKDNIINSGGIKIQIESVESLLHPYVSGKFAITAVPDAKFGEIVVMLIEGNESLNELKGRIEESLPKYQRPKSIYRVESIPLTETGKISRAECRRLAEEISKKK